MNIHEKLLVIQTKLECGKNQYNSFGGYNYRNCEDILEAVKPHLAETNTVVNLSDCVMQIGERFYVKAQATLIDVKTGEQIYSIAYAREEETKKGMDSSQVTGASSSYARKYALNGLFAIDDVKDSDTTNTHGKDTPKTTKETPSKSNTPTPTKTTENPQNTGLKCEQCEAEVTEKVAKFSQDNFGKKLCFACQQKNKGKFQPKEVEISDDDLPWN